MVIHSKTDIRRKKNQPRNHDSLFFLPVTHEIKYQLNLLLLNMTWKLVDVTAE